MDRGMTLVVNETSASYLSHHADNTGRMTMPRSRFDCFRLCTQLICTKLRGRTSNMRMPCQGIGPRCRAKAEVSAPCATFATSATITTQRAALGVHHLQQMGVQTEGAFSYLSMHFAISLRIWLDSIVAIDRLVCNVRAL